MIFKCRHGLIAQSYCFGTLCRSAGQIVCNEQGRCEACSQRHQKCELRNLQQLIADSKWNAEQSLTVSAKRWLSGCLGRVEEASRLWKERLNEDLSKTHSQNVTNHLRQTLNQKSQIKKPGFKLFRCIGLLLIWAALLGIMGYLCLSILLKEENIQWPLQTFNQTEATQPLTNETSMPPQAIDVVPEGLEWGLPVQDKTEPIPSFPLSSVITNDTELLASFFVPKVIKSTKLLYRASEHSFNIDLFHHYCDGQQNMLLLAVTEFDRVLGAYSPLPFESGVGFQHTADPDCTTFLFSVTNRQMFPLLLNEKGNALYNDAAWGPSYGHGCDLRISDRANETKGSYSRFPSSFYSPKHRDSKVARYHLTGSAFDRGFRIKQWEIFQINFLQ